MMYRAMSYNGAITREQWLLRETRIVARLRLDEGADDAVIVERVCAENLFQYPTARELRSLTRACLKRLDALSDEPARRARLTELVAHGTHDVAAQTNLYAMMRAYRLVGEFMVSVVGTKYRTRDMVLTRREIADFIDTLRRDDAHAARWTDATAAKLRQVLNKLLVEVGCKASVRSDALADIYLDDELAMLMVENGDACALPAFDCFRAVS